MSHPTPESADSEPCSECATGYLLHQEYGFADIPLQAHRRPGSDRYLHQQRRVLSPPGRHA
jgi:hypothetical protein